MNMLIVTLIKKEKINNKNQKHLLLQYMFEKHDKNKKVFLYKK
jgi:hypothetical protein